MKFEDITVGDLVYDHWWPLTTLGRVIEKSPSHATVRTCDRLLRYDKHHVQFLRRQDDQKKAHPCGAGATEAR